jgi:Kef-type K+ transport system membrane component KefB
MVALGGMILPFAVGWALMTALGYPTVPGVFMGAALVATSVGITARVLSGLGLLSTRSAQIILGAAVIDDILGLLVLTVVSGSAEGELRYGEIATVATLAIGFTAFMIIAGARIARRARPVVEHLKVGNAFFISAIALCLGLSLLATRMGVAPIIGAFLAGMALAEASEDTRLHHEVGAVTEFLVPFFLVGIGMQLQVAVFSNWQVLALSLGVTLAAIATKLLGCGAFALGSGRRSALQVGIGMVPRGEVGIIVAQVGRKVGALDDALYAVVVFMAVATTMIAPPLLTRLFRDEVPIEIADVDEVVDSDRELADLQ